MYLQQFLDFNHTCPVCTGNLTLFMQFSDSILWKAENSNNTIFFKPYKHQDANLGENQLVSLSSEKDDILLTFPSQSILTQAKKSNIFFFFICNLDGFIEIERPNKKAYEISPYKACYYRSSPFMDLEKIHNNWSLKTVSPPTINREEVICIIDKIQAKEDIYILNIKQGETDSEKSTIFWHYSITPEEAAKKYFEPKLFEKEVSGTAQRPDFSDRAKLIEKFNSWIILS